MDATPPDKPFLPASAVDATILPEPISVSPLPASPLVELPQPHIGWVILIFIGFLVYQVLIAAVIVLGLIVSLFFTLDVPQGEIASEIPKALMNGYGQEALIFGGSAFNCLFAFVLTWAVHRSATGRRVAMRWPNLWQGLLVLMTFLPLAIAVSEISNWISPILPTIGGEAFEQVMLHLSQMPLPLMIIAICVFPAVGEELLFRGFIGRGLVGRHGPVFGVLITSVLFGAVHIYPLQAICAAILGVVLHVVYLWTKSLLAPMLLHFLNNLFAMVCMRYSDTMPIPGVSVIGEEGVIHTPIALTLVSVTTCALLLFMLYQARSNWLAKDGGSYPFGYPTAETPADETATISAPLPNSALLVLAVGSFGGLLWLLGVIIRQSAG